MKPRNERPAVGFKGSNFRTIREEVCGSISIHPKYIRLKESVSLAPRGFVLGNLIYKYVRYFTTPRCRKTMF